MPSLPLLSLPPLPDALGQIAKFDPDQFAALLDAVSTEEGFGRGRERCERLSQTLGLDDPVTVFGVLASLSFLYEGPGQRPSDDQEYFESLREFLKSSELWSNLGKDPEAAFDRLIRLLQRNSSVDTSRKIQWLKTGILPNAISFASFVDLRPNFSEDRESIDSVVPVVVFSIETDEDGEESSHVFQLSEAGIKKFEDALQDVSKKLSALRNDPRVNALEIIGESNKDGS